MALGQYNGGAALYHLDGNANDSSGNGLNLTPGNILWVGGIIGSGSASLNGVSSYLLSTSNDLLLGATGVTISCWFKTSNSTANQIIVSDGGYITIIQSLSGNDGKIYCFSDGNSGAFAISNNNMADGLVHNVILTASSTTVYCYIDGVLNSSASNALNTGTHNRKTALGANYLASGSFFNGTIDEAILEKRQWSEVEVKKYYTYAKGRFIL